MQLTTNLSDPLLELVRRDEAPIDGVEAGPWFSVRQIREYRRRLPALPFTFHGGNLIERVGIIPGAVRNIAAYQRVTASPWVSMHITTWWPGMVWMMLRWGWRMPLPHPERATRRFVRRVGKLARSLRVPVILENVAPLPFEGYDFEVQPERISGVAARTGCDLLLDLGHARVSASTLGMDIGDYLRALPLDRVVQVHVSGPRVRHGRLVDAHQPLQQVDYDLLDFVLARAMPRMVTLEYIRERDALREQLVRLRRVVDAAVRSAGSSPGAGKARD